MSSSSANANDLATLQTAVKDLQSFQLNLPPSHQFDKENSSNSTTNNSTTTTLLKKYKAARQHYIQQRTTELFLDHLQQYNPRTHSFPLPAPITSSEHTNLQSRQEDVITAVRQTMESVNGALEEVHLKYEQLDEKKEEFVRIVDGMERAEHQRIMNTADGTDPGGDDSMYQDDMDEEDEEEITEQDVMEQEEHLHQLQQRKIELENRLRSVRLQIGTVEGDVRQVKGVVNEVRVKSGRKPLDWRGVDGVDSTAMSGGGDATVNNDDVEYICNDVDNEIAELQEKAAELKQSGEFYDGIRELMEELGGVKILSTSTTTTSSSDQQGEEEGFTLTLKLLGTHVLEIQLKSGRVVGAGSVGVGDTTSSLVVASAKLVTPTTFPMPEPTQPPSDQTPAEDNNTENLTETINQSLTNISLSKIMSQKQTVSIVIPPLDDLVHWSRSLESSQGIRFVLVETMARIRTLDARVAELTHLRQNYAAQVYDMDTASCSSEQQQQSSSSCQFGGAEQEVVCAINEGITVALRLTVDCPLVPGSVYISELFGVGGWEEKKLETLKKVVEERRCKGPVEVMEVMVKEIRRRRHEEGWAIPLTPSLPRGRN